MYLGRHRSARAFNIDGALLFLTSQHLFGSHCIMMILWNLSQLHFRSSHLFSFFFLSLTTFPSQSSIKGHFHANAKLKCQNKVVSTWLDRLNCPISLRSNRSGCILKISYHSAIKNEGENEVIWGRTVCLTDSQCSVSRQAIYFIFFLLKVMRNAKVKCQSWFGWSLTFILLSLILILRDYTTGVLQRHTIRTLIHTEVFAFKNT